MNNRQLLIASLLAGMSLGTAWAIRGQFGHVYGAAWAGAFIALIIVLLAKRPDWYPKAISLAFASAAGWGIGGIISYGVVVGYGRGTDFGNVYYGLLMLFVIGGLFGLLGGGLFGLVLADRPTKPVKWPQLITELTAGALIFYYFFVEEVGWLMTPPRSEAWAACFGMSAAMIWYMLRNQQYGALRVAILTGFGAAFGFAFGNFLQTMGSAYEIAFNFWNVMEYSIGFFGGISMAYATFTSQWEVEEKPVYRNEFLAQLIILVLIVPFVVWEQSFSTKKLTKILNEASPDMSASPAVEYMQYISLILLLGYFIYCLYTLYIKPKNTPSSIDFNKVSLLFFGFLTLYATLSLIKTGAFLSTYRVEQYLYFINIVVIYFLYNKFQPTFSNRGLNLKTWSINLAFTLAFIAILAVVAISSHYGLNGAETRF